MHTQGSNFYKSCIRSISCRQNDEISSFVVMCFCKSPSIKLLITFKFLNRRHLTL